MEVARGYRGIPAFGEWNYGDGDGDDWSVLAQRLESAMHAQFPVHKPCKRARAGRRRRVPAFGEWNNHGVGDGDAGGWTAAVVNQCFEPVMAHKSLKHEFNGYDSGGVAMGMHYKVARQTWVHDSAPHSAMEPFSFAAAKAVDDDLYDVPPDMPCAKPLRKGWTWMRSLLMRCCGLNCFA
ncbi:hypothetical protein D1007_46435 [Hordeum vulgare]|uniref:Uncharacterized protein n=1 Tax=Hordeum vulgare subsp. vulgare TaxID=112509 RepID=A0A8I6Z804_HORVV|nr:uncharacterized protein LOC123412092 [Hordeum vulgare subsp. vulgare]KAE8780417.1 hypothetical protein D1007_46435 [Hordeum vulgare]